MRGIIKFLIVFFILLAGTAVLLYSLKTPEQKPAAKHAEKKVDNNSLSFTDKSNFTFKPGGDWCALKAGAKDFPLNKYAETLAANTQDAVLLAKDSCMDLHGKNSGQQILLLAVELPAEKTCEGAKLSDYKAPMGKALFCFREVAQSEPAIQFAFPANKLRSLVVITNRQTYAANRKDMEEFFRSFTYNIK